MYYHAAAKAVALRDNDVHLFVCSFVCRPKRVIVGHWPAWSTRGPGPRGPRVSHRMFPRP